MDGPGPKQTRVYSTYAPVSAGTLGTVGQGRAGLDEPVRSVTDSPRHGEASQRQDRARVLGQGRHLTFVRTATDSEAEPQIVSFWLSTESLYTEQRFLQTPGLRAYSTDLIILASSRDIMRGEGHIQPV
jgi:hypothetical protein